MGETWPDSFGNSLNLLRIPKPVRWLPRNHLDRCSSRSQPARAPFHFEEKRNLAASFPVGRTAPLDLWCSWMISHPWLPSWLTMVSLWVKFAVGNEQPSEATSRMNEYRMSLRRVPKPVRWLPRNHLDRCSSRSPPGTGLF